MGDDLGAPEETFLSNQYEKPVFLSTSLQK